MSDNEKINWTPELLAECRNEKGVVFGMMSDEARMALRANREHAERFMSDGWIGRPEVGDFQSALVRAKEALNGIRRVLESRQNPGGLLPHAPCGKEHPVVGGPNG